MISVKSSPAQPPETPPAHIDVSAVPAPAPALPPTPAVAAAPPPSAEAARPIDASPPRIPAQISISKPMARTALSFVGADPDAEAIWFAAINDPSFSPHDRQDLIEDLNEEGFPDPKHITPDDLPLIVNRLALIEELAPDAMDDTNAAAFAEAYKDLVNMYARLTQQQ